MKVLNSLYDKNLDEILGGNTPGGNPPGVFYPTTMAEFKSALEDQSFTDKFIYCTSSINIDSNLSISAIGFNFLVFGVSFRASGDYTITFSQPAESYTVIHSARGIGLETTNFSFTRNISFVSTNDTYMTINTSVLSQVKVNLTVTGLSFKYEKLNQGSSTLTGNIAQAIVNTTTPNASTTSPGLMSDSDKSRLDNIYDKVRKPATLVVGNTAAGHTTNICDYLCDGTADEVEINAAITALPATGGEILILEGTYNIAAKVSINKSDVTIRGLGSNTKLNRQWSGVSPGEGVLQIDLVNRVKIESLQVIGNSDTYPGIYSYGINIKGGSGGHIIRDILCSKCYHGIYCNNTAATNILIENNNCSYCNGYGIGMAITSGIIRGNTCFNNSLAGIGLVGGSYNVVANNICRNNDIGIRLDSVGLAHTVTGNLCYQNTTGIEAVVCNSSIISDNLCVRGTGLASDYSASQYTIWLSDGAITNTLVSNNHCLGKDVTTVAGTKVGLVCRDNKVTAGSGKYTTTVATADWSGASAPYTATKTITGLLTTDRPHITVDYNATLATALLEKAAYACIDEVEVTATDTLVFRCFETKPTQTLNIIVEVY